MQGFSFVDGELQHQPFDCICGRRHDLPIKRVLVQPGALDEVAAVAAGLNPGPNLVVVADENTMQAAGQTVLDQLRSAGYAAKPCMFSGKKWVKPDEFAIGAVMLTMDTDTSLLVSVGSGSLTDLTRFVSHRTGVPFMSVATAPSMDGYAGNGAPMTHGGFKRTIYATHAQAVIADTDVLAAAPYDMVTSGFADTLAKLTSRIDWKLSQIITGEYYCPVLVDGVTEAAFACVSAADALARGDREAVLTLTEALVTSGVAMLLAGNSRPASGTEHSLSHYWEMKSQAFGLPEYFHGTKVGVGTCVTAAFLERLLARDPGDIDRNAVRKNKHTLEFIEQELRERLGPVAETVIAEVSRPVHLEWPAQELQIDRLARKWPEIRALSHDAPSLDTAVKTLRSIKAPWRPSDIDVDLEYLSETLAFAKEVRSRYTMLRAAETLGWLDEVIDEVVSLAVWQS